MSGGAHGAQMCFASNSTAAEWALKCYFAAYIDSLVGMALPSGATSTSTGGAHVSSCAHRPRKSVARWSPDDISSPTGYTRPPHELSPEEQVRFKCSSCLNPATYAARYVRVIMAILSSTACRGKVLHTLPAYASWVWGGGYSQCRVIQPI